MRIYQSGHYRLYASSKQPPYLGILIKVYFSLLSKVGGQGILLIMVTQDSGQQKGLISKGAGNLGEWNHINCPGGGWQETFGE